MNDLYESTLIVFTTANGGQITHGASNYPFRGSVGEVHDGNNRVLTSVAGGYIENKGVGGSGQVRNQLFSNLDWTPTLLDFAGYLECIDPADYTWDGISQHNLIMNLYLNPSDYKRPSLVLNVGDKEMKDASVIVDHNGRLFKYIKVRYGCLGCVHWNDGEWIMMHCHFVTVSTVFVESEGG